MRFRLSLLLSTLFLAGCMSSEPEQAPEAPPALTPPALQPVAASPANATPVAPASSSLASQGTPPADQPLPLGALPEDNAGQQAFNCRTVGNATMCDLAGDPNADSTGHTN